MVERGVGRAPRLHGHLLRRRVCKQVLLWPPALGRLQLLLAVAQRARRVPRVPLLQAVPCHREARRANLCRRHCRRQPPLLHRHELLAGRLRLQRRDARRRGRTPVPQCRSRARLPGRSVGLPGPRRRQQQHRDALGRQPVRHRRQLGAHDRPLPHLRVVHQPEPQESARRVRRRPLVRSLLGNLHRLHALRRRHERAAAAGDERHAHAARQGHHVLGEPLRGQLRAAEVVGDD
mmetsp:Transcript_46008/g.149498  ORF Transcript_46008/g.149498 Transcript_46008/m.149498 type:complete len:234 (-) Transcript_46008:106-807(-)